MPNWLRVPAKLILFWVVIIVAAQVADSFQWANLSVPVCEEHQEHAHQESEANCLQHPQSLGELLVLKFGSFTAEQIIALFTVVLTVATILLWRSTDKLWTAGEKQTRVTLIATRAAARAATKQLRLSEGSSEKQLRAYVGIESIVLAAPNIGGQNYKPHVPKAGTSSPDGLQITVQNFGETPANDVHMWVNWQPMPFGQRLPSGFPYPDYGLGDKGPNGLRTTLSRPTVFPRQMWPQDISIDDLTPFIAANRSEASLYVYGHIDYRDVFGAQRATEFCFVCHPGGGGAGGKTFVPYEEHNEAK